MVQKKNRKKKKKNNILDKVMKSAREKEKTAFDPIKVVSFIIQDLPPRPSEIIKDRFGLEEGTSKTLQEIGEKFGVTRERVRQIESQTKAILKDKLQKEEIVQDLLFIRKSFEEIGGFSSFEFILDKLLGPDKTDAIKAKSINFILELGDDFIRFPGDSIIKEAYTLKEEYLNEAREIVSFLVDFLKGAGRPYLENELFPYVEKEVRARNYLYNFSKGTLGAILDLSEDIIMSSFGEWGLKGWPEITPQSIRQKAYLVLKKHGKPSHFVEVAELINQANFNSKKANPGTVHNELIKGERFILIGCGTYALSEWGFRKGTVADIIKKILAKSSKPLTKDEIVNRVLKERQVKTNTILLALQGKQIKKDKNGRYWI